MQLGAEGLRASGIGAQAGAGGPKAGAPMELPCEGVHSNMGR